MGARVGSRRIEGVSSAYLPLPAIAPFAAYLAQPFEQLKSLGRLLHHARDVLCFCRGIGLPIVRKLNSEPLLETLVIFRLVTIDAQIIPKNEALPHLSIAFSNVDVVRSASAVGWHSLHKEQPIVFRI